MGGQGRGWAGALIEFIEQQSVVVAVAFGAVAMVFAQASLSLNRYRLIV